MAVADPLSKTHTELAAQWHPTRNEGIMPEDVRAYSYKKVWWRCPKDPRHEWEAKVSRRTFGRSGCPFCAGQRFTPADSLPARFPEFAAEWHFVKNAPTRPEDVGANSSKRVWWMCCKDPRHEWATAVVRRTRGGSGCPHCRGRYLTPENSLAGIYPQIAALWHPTKNGAAKPEQFRANSLICYLTFCSVGHEPIDIHLCINQFKTSLTVTFTRYAEILAIRSKGYSSGRVNGRLS